jgi:RNA polymerase sigma-70 factor (ECF subfamily)
MTTIGVKAGDDPALAVPRLIELYGSRIYHLGLRLCGSEADAEDLVQETFLQAYRRWETFEGRSQPGTWLYTIATRLCRRKHRKRAGEPDRTLSLDEVSPFGEQSAHELPGDGGDPAALRVRAEATERVQDAIVTLPPAYRLPIVLKDIIEMSIAEVAQVLQLKEATVKTRVHRARLLLRKALVEGLPEKDTPKPAYSRRICLDLLKTKLESQDRGEAFPVGNSVVCERCRAVFASLDMTRDVCGMLGQGSLPDELKANLERIIARETVSG